MISADGVVRYCKSLLSAGAVYIWGADGDIVTRALIDDLKKKFGTDHYKNIDIDRVEGCIGADCSGMLTSISGFDTTADGYYRSAKVKGRAIDVPTDKVCLVFREESGKIVHVGVYCGDGYTIEMYNDCERKPFTTSKWTYYGIPGWIEQTANPLKKGDKVTLRKSVTGHNTAADAINGTKTKGSVVPGEYIVYKVYGKAINVSKYATCPGSWIKWS